MEHSELLLSACEWSILSCCSLRVQTPVATHNAKVQTLEPVVGRSEAERLQSQLADAGARLREKEREIVVSSSQHTATVYFQYWSVVFEVLLKLFSYMLYEQQIAPGTFFEVPSSLLKLAKE